MQGQRVDLTTNTVTNPKNDDHIMAIVIRIGRTTSEDVVDIDEDFNKIGSYERANKKKKIARDAKECDFIYQ